MPNDRLMNRRVVASCYLSDEVFLVLSLNREAPYFSVAEVTYTDEGWKVLWAMVYDNIVPAVAVYEQYGGDY
jgi:hypothetical protein